jgi:hypothetical protein
MWERVYSPKRNIGVEEVWGELKACYRALCIKCLAFRADGGWLNIKVTGFLSRRSEEELRAKVMQEYDQLKDLGVTKIDKLLVAFSVYNAARFPEIIEQLSSGSLTVSGERVRLGESVKLELLPHSHLYSQEPYDFPRISLVATSADQGSRLDSESVREIEEELKECGYMSLDELGLQWLMLPGIRGYGYDVMVDIPIYFLPMSVDLVGNEVVFRAICHKALAQKLRLRITLRRALEGGYSPVNYVPVENYMCAFPEPSEELGEVRVRQALRSSLRREDIVECVVTSRLGVVTARGERVEHLLQAEIPGRNFSRLISQFIALDELEELLESKQVGGEIKRPDLSFQRVVAWLFSVLGFQVVELEGTAYKTLKEEDGTLREADVLMYDPQTEKTFVVDVTLRAPPDKKIDDIANLQHSLMRRGIFAEPIVVVGELATQSKRNVRNVKVLDYEDLQAILSALREGNVEKARKLIIAH